MLWAISGLRSTTDTRKKKKINNQTRSIDFLSRVRLQARKSNISTKTFFLSAIVSKIVCKSHFSSCERVRVRIMSSKKTRLIGRRRRGRESRQPRDQLLSAWKNRLSGARAHRTTKALCSLPINSGRRSKPLPGVGGAAGHGLYRVIELIPPQSSKLPPRHIFAVFIITVNVMVTDNPVTLWRRESIESS